MLDNASPAVARAWDLAKRLAEMDLSAEVRARHLVDALLYGEPEGQAAVAARAAGMAVAEVSRWGQFTAACPELVASAEAEGAFDEARRLARLHVADKTVTGDLLLLAIVRVNSEMAHSLAAAGLEVARLEQALTGALLPALELTEPIALADPVEQIVSRRILDANANRVREGLRVLEEFARFGLGDAHLSGLLKSLRHDLTGALDQLDVAELAEARDTEQDVGTRLMTRGEYQREDMLSVLIANAKRLQESLRCLEEFAKVRGGTIAATFEQLRYRSYTVERLLILNFDARQRLGHARLYLLLTGTHTKLSLDWVVAEATAGGVDIVQLREKDLDDRRLLERARRMRHWTRQAGVLFIVNDRPDIARLCEADGVHLGQDDMSIAEARRIVGPRALIGVSTHTVAQVRQAVSEGASYIGVGPTFSSTTKRFDDLAGLEFVRAATMETSLPAFVLGGVNADNVGQVVAAGGSRVAVSAAIAACDDPRVAARAIRAQLDANSPS